MGLFLYISQFIIPVFVLYVVGYGILEKVSVYEVFVKGAKEGMETVIKIAPTLVGLMTATGVLRASGILEQIGTVTSYLIPDRFIPGELVPLGIVRMFSSSAATGLLLDVYKAFGTDSRIGLIASLMMSSTETVFYTMSLYYGTVGVKKTRFTLPGALIATAGGMAASIILGGKIFG